MTGVPDASDRCDTPAPTEREIQKRLQLWTMEAMNGPLPSTGALSTSTADPSCVIEALEKGLEELRQMCLENRLTLTSTLCGLEERIEQLSDQVVIHYGGRSPLLLRHEKPRCGGALPEADSPPQLVEAISKAASEHSDAVSRLARAVESSFDPETDLNDCEILWSILELDVAAHQASQRAVTKQLEALCSVVRGVQEPASLPTEPAKGQSMDAQLEQSIRYTVTESTGHLERRLESAMEAMRFEYEGRLKETIDASQSRLREDLSRSRAADPSRAGNGASFRVFWDRMEDMEAKFVRRLGEEVVSREASEKRLCAVVADMFFQQRKHMQVVMKRETERRGALKESLKDMLRRGMRGIGGSTSRTSLHTLGSSHSMAHDPELDTDWQTESGGAASVAGTLSNVPSKVDLEDAMVASSCASLPSLEAMSRAPSKTDVHDGRGGYPRPLASSYSAPKLQVLIPSPSLTRLPPVDFGPACLGILKADPPLRYPFDPPVQDADRCLSKIDAELDVSQQDSLDDSMVQVLREVAIELEDASLPESIQLDRLMYSGPGAGLRTGPEPGSQAFGMTPRAKVMYML